MCKVNDHKRKCTDCGCCILFFAWWVVWIVIAIVALDKGDPVQLVYGQDYQGAQCGIYDYDESIAFPDHRDQKKVVYPRMSEDLLKWSTSYGIDDISQIDWTTLGWDLIKDLNLTGVCVESCPKYGDVICTDHYRYNNGGSPSQEDAMKCYTDAVFAASNRHLCDNCWVMALNTTDVFNRCLELIQTTVNKESNCFFPSDASSADPEDCITIDEVVTSSALKPAYSDPFQEYLSSGFQLLTQVLSDLTNAQTVIWTCGVAGPFVLAFVYIFSLYFCAWPLVWGTVVGYLLVHLWVSIWLWMQSGYLDFGELENSVVFGGSGENTLSPSDLSSNETEIFDSVSINDSERTNDFYLGSAILSSVLYAVGICIIAAVYTEVKISVKIIQETSKAIYKMPTLIFYPIFSIAAICLLILYFLTVGTYMLTMDDVTPSDLAADTGFACDQNCTTSLNFTAIVAGCADATPQCPLSTNPGCDPCTSDQMQTFFVSYMTNASNEGHFNCTASEIDAQVYGSWDCGVGFVDADTSLNQLMFVFHIFSFLWTLNFVDAIGICVIAGAVCQWYWILPTKGGTKQMPSKFPVLSAITRTYRFHLGTMAYGSAIVAVVQLIRAIMAYVDHKTKNIQEKNCVVRYLMKVVHCCLWCFEKCIKFITKNAYIYVAMRGYSFCKASRNAFGALVSNMKQFAVTSVITSIFILLGKLLITLSVGFFAYLWVEYDDDFGKGKDNELHLPVLPVIVTALVAYFCSTLFLDVYDLSISSILLCFCEDYKMHVQTNKQHMAFMSQSLRNAVMGGKVLTTDKVEEAIAKNQKVNSLAEAKVSENSDVTLHGL